MTDEEPASRYTPRNRANRVYTEMRKAMAEAPPQESREAGVDVLEGAFIGTEKDLQEDIERLEGNLEKARDMLQSFADLENWWPDAPFDDGMPEGFQTAHIWDGENVGIEEPWDAAQQVLAEIEED